jgi:hypothetical protein
MAYGQIGVPLARLAGLAEKSLLIRHFVALDAMARACSHFAGRRRQ